MNTPLRRVSLAMLAMIVLLLANATYIQVVEADSYRTDPRNQRVLFEEYSRQRGQILSQFGGYIIANVEETNNRLRFLRKYTDGPMYAPVTGYYSVRYGAGGLERAEDSVLNGSDDRLFVRRLSDLITGRDPRGGNVEVTVHPKAQEAAYKAMTAKGHTGSVVALKPQTGEILAMVSTPSYDPSRLAAHNADAQQESWNELIKDKGEPMANRAISRTYPPGSTFKLVVAAAALEAGETKDTQLTAAREIKLPKTNTTLENFNNNPCGGGSTASLETAVRLSCNTAFAELAGKVGTQKLTEQAAKFGIGQTDLQIPMRVAASGLGPIADEAALYQTGIGQRDVALTPLQDAVVAATIANGGVRMLPQLVKSIKAPDLEEISGFDPDEVERAMSRSNAEALRDMMIKSEENTQGDGKRSDLTIASKTGTAEHGNDPKRTPPHAWYVAFAPADKPEIAVAVLVENGGDRGLAATGGKVAAGIGRATMNAYLGGR
ncbi:peptidoglycan glycosyltransferase [Herbihabitans rhizosphaerae]|uniref:Peptidoglycan glycosyltransferase n=1 Tax=Herbihabitans rhizosphaerae TaxID=1872711 RepID=A0A4Q7KMM8_9PSEU|nr:penicillin-binding protein 2 [Herbihabitans rhizosphaerae]RZS37537.1 peptidoglycan glycosyltransferase [Herbihabitans rhizosphaerae]